MNVTELMIITMGGFGFPFADYGDYGEGSGLEIVHGEEVEESTFRVKQQRVKDTLKYRYFNSNIC